MANTTHRFKSLKTPRKFNVIWCEHLNNGTIAANSRLYCGCCGQQMGEVITDLTFPFDTGHLIEATKNISFRSTIAGCLHITCNQMMFVFDSWHFKSVRELFALTHADRETTRLLKEIPADEQNAV